MKRTLVSLAAAVAFSVGNAQASGIPVVDAASIAQAVMQLEQLQSQLQQMKQLYNSTVGSRGFSGLINNPALRSYLPGDVNTILNAVSAGASGDLSGLAKQIVAASSVLTPEQMASLTGTSRTVITNQRNSAASQKAAADTAFKAASDRFATLQALIDAIDGATDQKAIQDLTARINAEQVMMQNENAKLQSLASAAAAQKQMNEQRSREEALRFIDTKPPRF